jgi:hypothetical protein
MKLTSGQFAAQTGILRNSISRLCKQGKLTAELITDSPVPYYVIETTEAEVKRYAATERKAGRPRKERK